MRKGRVLIVITVIVSMNIVGFADGVLAGRAWRTTRHSVKKSEVPRSHKHVLRIPPRPPGWPQMWLARDIIKSFNENGLIVDNTIREKGIELSALPAKINESIKFTVSLNDRNLKGCVLKFDKKKEFNKVKNHYLELNNNNELHTWSLVKDNILVVIDGAMSEKEIQGYKTVLADME